MTGYAHMNSHGGKGGEAEQRRPVFVLQCGVFVLQYGVCVVQYGVTREIHDWMRIHKIESREGG